MAMTIGGKTPQSIEIGGKAVQSLAIGGEVVWSAGPPQEYFNLKNEYSGQNTVSLNKSGSPTDITLEYSKDKSTWTTWSSANGDLSITLDQGETVYMRGNNSTFSTSSANKFYFSATQSVSAGGNVMSLIDDTMQADTIPNNHCFAFLFTSCSNLISAPELPATTLKDGCYYRMFYNCTSLVEAPELPATALANICYDSMFKGCTSLTTVHKLPATTLANSCYQYMFDGCSALTTVPSDMLPATTARDYCYQYMFNNCSSLVEAPVINITSAFTKSFYYMFCNCGSLNKVTTYLTYYYNRQFTSWLSGVSATGDFYNLGGATFNTGTDGIPSGWTEHTSM